MKEGDLRLSVVPVDQIIRTYMQKNGLDVNHLVQKCGISRQRSQVLLSGESSMTAEEYLAFCQALHVDVDYFYKLWQEKAADTTMTDE